MTGPRNESKAGADARHERARGCHVPADEARERARKWRLVHFDEDAAYWDAYADEVESW